MGLKVIIGVNLANLVLLVLASKYGIKSNLLVKKRGAAPLSFSFQIWD